MKVVTARADFLTARASLAAPVGFVPTMGALHAGHESLLTVARGSCASVAATIFVNPLQFGAGEDLARYPRTLHADLLACEAAGVDLVWTPAVEDVYLHGPAQVRIDAGELGNQLEGALRPGHFAGMLTVVGKFFTIVRPELAFFGQKDYQQCFLVQRMVHDLDYGIGIVAVPTVREPDGLALSSRNVYLSPDDRQQALGLSRALFAGVAAAGRGSAAVLAEAAAVLSEHPRVAADYLELRDVDLGRAPAHGIARLLVAARVGTTRLIDNVEVVLA